MPPQVSEVQSEILHEQIVPAFLQMLDSAPALDDPAELEQLAATVLVALEQPDIPADAVSAVLAAIEARRDPDAAGVLAAIAVLATEPLATHAAASTQRLASEGIVSRAAAGLGMLAVQEAVRIEGAGVELLVALLRRPDSSEVQAAMLAIEHEHTDGALVQCALAPPARFHDARELLDGIDGASAPEPVAPGELAARAVAAARRAVQREVALDHQAGPALPIVSRALTGDPAGLPRPVVLAPWEDDDPELIVDPAEDEDGFQRVMELLLSELEQHAKATYPPDSVVWEHGDFVASTMLQWKGGYHDGRLGRWTQADLAEYLLDYFPRKVSVDDETLAAVPDCARAFLGFLEERGSLTGEPLEQLEHALDELRDEFCQRARDRTHWGLAKSMVMQMHAEGLDPSAPGALDTWITDFNTRPLGQRDQIIGPAADRMAHAAGLRSAAAPRAPKQQRAQQRKAQRAARKHNRRR
ncbi:MAG: hypothetical protein ACRDM7_23925 [Thermoleophilaceae bacterium]